MDTFALPEGAVLLATGHGVRNQAYRVGDRTWGIQFHFEVDRPELEMWLDEYSKKDDLGASWGKSTDQIRAEADAYQAAHEDRGREIFRRFASVSNRALIRAIDWAPGHLYTRTRCERTCVSPARRGRRVSPRRRSRCRGGRTAGYGVPAPYIEALRRAGARIAILAPGEDRRTRGSARALRRAAARGRRRRRPGRVRCRARPRAQLRRRAATATGSRSSSCCARRPAGPTDPLHLSWDAGHERRVRRHAHPASARTSPACSSTESRSPARPRSTRWRRSPGAGSRP